MKDRDLYPKYLPIGTVVLLTGGTKKLMIIGFAISSKSLGDKIYDYAGVCYPEGLLAPNQFAAFNHSQIEKIFFMGYNNDEEKAFNQKLKILMESKKEDSREIIREDGKEDERDRRSIWKKGFWFND